MGFYGNIRNTTSNSFKFDRIYSNRATMELHADDDGVFGGRYVLVEYDQAIDENPVDTPVILYKVGDLYFVSLLTSLKEEEMPHGYLTYDSVNVSFEDEVKYAILKDEIDPNIYPKGTTIKEIEINHSLSEDIPIYYENGSLPREIAEDYNPYGDTPYFEVIWTPEETVEKSERLFVINTDGGDASVPQSTDLPMPENEANYTVNYAIDRAVYGIGRGYDSTVWRKVYSEDGKAKYVSVAELNSVVPTFAVTADAPYDVPTIPHWDKDSTNVYYNLHLQSPWAFRIADIDDAGSYASTVLEISDAPPMHSLKKYDEQGQYISPYDGSGHYVIAKEVPYNGAIYFNRAGFAVEESVHSGFELEQNQIRIDDYKSGLKYPDRDNLNSVNKVEAFDTKELSIILPAIGDTVAEMWDKIYGTERKLNISWDDANSKSDWDEERLRLVHDDNYTPEDSETLAGVINSAHDLLGMIITDPVSSTDGEVMPNDANEAHQWQIYYNPPAYVKTKDQERQENKTYYTYNENNDSYDTYAENPWPETVRPTIYEQVSKRNPNFDGNKYYYAGATLGFEEVEYPFKEKDINGNVINDIDTAEEFKAYFGEENQGYVKVHNLKDMHAYTNDSTKDPIFSNYENGNIYKRVKKNIESATAGELYYTIPTNLTYVAAAMRPNDGKEWYYHPEVSGVEDENIYQQLPEEEKESVLGNDKDYFWIEEKVATGSESGNAYVMSVRKRPLFRTWTLKNAEAGNIESNRIYDYAELPQFPDRYRRGLYTSFEDIVEQAGATIVEEDGKKYGKNGNTYYSLDYVFYITGTTTYYNPDTDEWITGNTYKGRDVSQILFADHEITQDAPYYLYKKEQRGNLNVYTRLSWGQLVDQEDLTTATPYKYEVKTTRLKHEGECYYFKLDTSTTEGQAKMRELSEWVANENRETDELDIKQAGYLNYILEFNRNKIEDSLNPNYYYFVADGEPTATAYGIAEKKSAHEEDLIVFYTEKTLYFLDPEDELYKKANKENHYEFDETTYGSDDDHWLYRKNNEYYIIDCGDFPGFNIYQKFNAEIIQEDEDLNYFFGPKTEQKLKKPIKIGYGYKEYEWKELYGFARDVNTLHGWLLRLNEILQPSDTKTRDPNTIQGCINQLHDLLERFEPLIPGELYGVNEYGNLGPVALNSDNENGESWIQLESSFDPNTGQMILNVVHNDIYNFSDNDSTHAPLSTNANRATELMGYVDALKDVLDADALTEDKLHDPFGFIPEDGTGNRILLHSPVIDNSGHVVGEKETELMLSDLLLKTNGTAIINTLESPNGNVTISSGDTLRQALNKLITHMNAGADNITLNDYNEYYGDDTANPVVSPAQSMGDDVDDDDNINEAIAKLQWQLNHIANRLLTDLKSATNTLPNNYTPFTNDTVSGAIAATDTLGVGLNKLQKQIEDLNSRVYHFSNRKLVDLGTNGTTSKDPLSANDTLGQGLTKLQNRIYDIENFQVEGALIVNGDNTENEQGLTNIFAGIIRSEYVPTKLTTGMLNDEISVPNLRSGWIWVDTVHHYIYIKTQEGVNLENNSDSITRNYWELLNAWQ